MRTFFEYNWMVREEWYRWCRDLAEEELLRERTGGAGSILRTLFHIIDVEWSWIRIIQGKPDPIENFDEYRNLEKVIQLDRQFRPEVEEFVYAWNDSMERRPFYDSRPGATVTVHAWGEVMRHVIAHEIHHIGQLSIWSREVGKVPASANVIGRGLIQADITG